MTVAELLSLFERPEGQRIRLIVKPKDNDVFENEYGKDKKMKPYYNENGDILGYIVSEGYLNGMPDEYMSAEVTTIENIEPEDVSPSNDGFITAHIRIGTSDNEERAQTNSVIAKAVNEYANLSVIDAQAVGKKLEAYGFLRGLLAAYDMYISIDKPDIIVINRHKDRKEVYRWERS